MLNKEDIESIVQSGEGYNAEFKVRVPNKLKELTEEICAFANAAGGVLLLGVDDDNVIQGLTINNSKRSSIQNSLNEINPHLSTELYKVDVNGKGVWVIEVNSGNQKPYVLSGVIHVRQGPNTQKLTTVEQMRDFFQQSDRIYFDEAPCSDFNITTDIDSSFFEEFRLEAGLSKVVSQEQIINNLRLISVEGSFKNGAVLFFGEHPETVIETAVIRCIAFEGTSKTQIIDDKIFGGHLLGQYKQSMQWLKNKLNIRYDIKGGGARKEIWEIPETAFKEVIINALSHRDYYDKGARITIELFSDRVEISNPGGLTNAITLGEFGTKSHSRNPLIFGLFVRIAMVEQVGSGIGRIKDLLKKAKLSEPIFKTEGIFTVILKRELTTQETTQETAQELPKKTSDRILEILINDPKVSRKDIALLLEDITEDGVKYHLNKMKKEGVIKHEGSTKSGHWVILAQK